MSFSALFRSSSLDLDEPCLRMDLTVYRPGFEPGCALTWVCDAVSTASPPGSQSAKSPVQIKCQWTFTLSCPSLSNFVDSIYKVWAERDFLKLGVSDVAQSCLTLCDPMDCSLSHSSIHGIFQARCWSGLPFPSPGDLPDPGIEPASPTLQAETLPSEPPGRSLGLRRW